MTEKQDEPQAEVVTGKDLDPIEQAKLGAPPPLVPAVVPSNPMEMIGVAVAAGAPIEKLEALMALQERWEAGQAKKAYDTAFAAFKENPPELTKNASVSFRNKAGSLTEYDHATLDQVVNALTPPLSAHGLSHSWKINQFEGGLIEVSCVLKHQAGHSECATLKSGKDDSGGKNSIQAIASTVSYLQRYTLLAVTGMAVAGMDVDGFIPMDKINKTELAELNAKLDEAEVDKIALCKHMGVDSLADLMLRDLGRALTAIAAKRRKKGSDNEGS